MPPVTLGGFSFSFYEEVPHHQTTNKPGNDTDNHTAKYIAWVMNTAYYS